MTEKRDTRFRAGQSGNPDGRPRKHPPSGPAFGAVWGQRHTVMQNGVERELTVEEALQLRVVHAAIAGNTKALRKVLDWIEDREQWRAKGKTGRKPKPEIVLVRERDSDNAFAAMCLLGIATEREGGRPEERMDDQIYAPDFGWVELASWSIKMAFERKPSLWEDEALKHSLWMERLHPDQMAER